MFQIKPAGWMVLIAATVIIGAVSVHRFAPQLIERIAPSKPVSPSTVPPRAQLPDPNRDPNRAAHRAFDFPMISAQALEAGCADLPEVRWAHWAWNTHAGLILANGGPRAAKNSKMCAHGVNLKLTREDEVPQQQAQLVAFAQALAHGNPHPNKGTHFVSIMGDGAAAFFAELNAVLERKLGPEYRAQVIGSCGYSRGEDTFMGPPAWKKNPHAARGGLAAGYLRDGDWNIAMKWLGDNGLCNNPDETTYNPGCLNWVNASDYIDAAQKYVAGYCEQRPVVHNGKKTGRTQKVCVNSVATWTPGDVIVAQKRGGLVRIAATDVYRYQMPNTIIGIRKWTQANPKIVEGMLSAIFEANDEIRVQGNAFNRAMALSAITYREDGADASYWARYFRGVTERDAQGLNVQLGGSSVNNLSDNLELFGLRPGGANIFKATYETFGDIVVQQYPKLVPNYPPVERILDTRFIEAIAAARAPSTPAERSSFSASDPIREVVSRKAWRLRFKTGRATFDGAAKAQLEQLFRDLIVAGGAAVEVHGHTDNQGSVSGNQALSERRAFAVKTWLKQHSPTNFPEGRVRVFAHGQTNPIAENSTFKGRAKNRRVEIVLGTTQAPISTAAIH